MIALIDNSPIGPYRYSVQRFRSLMKEISERQVEALSFGQLVERKVFEKVKGAEAIILGGFGAWVPRRSYPVVYSREFRLVKESNAPILAICGGHQLLAVSMGGAVEYMGRLIKGFRRVEVAEPDPLFEGLDKSLVVRQAHHDQVTLMPEGFTLLASSKDTKVEVIRSKRGLVYGVQFHPERYNRRYPDGRVILENFWRVAQGSR